MKPFKHQEDIVSRSWQEKGWALFCDTGTGKTKMAIDTALWLDSIRDITGVLIVAPAGVYRNWSDIELPKHVPMPYRVDVYKSSMSAKAKHDLLAKVANRCSEMWFLCMNVEAFSHPKSEAVKIAETFLKSHRVLMIIDESTQIKVPSSRKTKTLLRLGGLAAYRRVLSGMPVTESPENLYTQCLFLRTDGFSYRSFYAFRNRFCTLETKFFGSRKVEVVTGAQRQEELNQLITSFGSIIHKSECLDLPDKVYQRRTVELTKEQRDALAQLKKEARIQYENNEMTAVNTLVMMEKQHQVVTGFFKTDDGKLVDLPNNREQALLDQLEETQGKVVIWTNYIRCIERVSMALMERYGWDSVAMFFGATAPEARPEIMDRFQNGDLRFLVANPATGKYGWTLTAAHTSIFYSNSYKLEDRHQAEDRLHRIGQTNKVTYIDLVTPGTVDEIILEALREKRNIAAEIMGSAWREALAA